MPVRHLFMPVKNIEDWDPNKFMASIGKKITVQPILMYTVSTPKKQILIYKSWGGIQSDSDADKEVVRITKELGELSQTCEFPIEFKPVRKVKTVEEAARVHSGEFDAVIVYAARGGWRFVTILFFHIQRYAGFCQTAIRAGLLLV